MPKAKSSKEAKMMGGGLMVVLFLLVIGHTTNAGMQKMIRIFLSIYLFPGRSPLLFPAHLGNFSRLAKKETARRAKRGACENHSFQENKGREREKSRVGGGEGEISLNGGDPLFPCDRPTFSYIYAGGRGDFVGCCLAGEQTRRRRRTLFSRCDL